MKCHLRNVSELVPPCLCSNQLIQQLAHHQLASYETRMTPTSCVSIGLDLLSHSPVSFSISLHLGFSLHRSPPGISLAGLPVKNSSLLVSAFPRPAAPHGRNEAAGFGWDTLTPPFPPRACPRPRLQFQPTVHSSSR